MTYYASCAGRQTGDGSQASPWRNVALINAHVFQPGDTLLFADGTQCNQQLRLHGSGTSANPIRVGSYGSGAEPVLSGNGGISAILLTDVEGWEFSGLEITNPTPSPGDDSGILVVPDSSFAGKTCRCR